MQRFTRNVPRKRGPYRNVIVGLKWCPHCQSLLAVDGFGFDRTRDDGLSGWCRRCRADGEQKRRDANPEAMRAALRARYHREPEKWHAKVAVARALAEGILSKPMNCPVCRRARLIEAHHHRGYDRRFWLDVVWRCRQCHTLEHRRAAEATQKRAVA
jgi:hypothetical protein